MAIEADTAIIFRGPVLQPLAINQLYVTAGVRRDAQDVVAQVQVAQVFSGIARVTAFFGGVNMLEGAAKFPVDGIGDVVHLNGLRHVVNEVNQVGDTAKGQQHGHAHGEALVLVGDGAFFDAADHHQCINKGGEENAEGNLGAAVADKVAHQMRAKLVGGQGQGHGGDGKHGPRHGDGTAGDGRKQRTGAVVIAQGQPAEAGQVIDVQGLVQGQQGLRQHNSNAHHDCGDQPEAGSHALEQVQQSLFHGDCGSFSWLQLAADETGAAWICVSALPLKIGQGEGW